MRAIHPLTLFVLVSAPALHAQEVSLYATDFTNLDGWTVVTGCDGPQWSWAADATPDYHPPGPFVSPPASLNFNDGVDIGGGSHGGPTSCGWVTSSPVDLAPAAAQPRLRFWASWLCEWGCGWDILTLLVRSASNDAVLFSECLNTSSTNTWKYFEFELDASWGEVKIEFEFDAVDGWDGLGTGPFIDDLEIYYHTPVSYTLACPGDGTGTACPCGNHGGADTGCVNSTGAGARMIASGSASVTAGDLVLATTQLRPNQFGTYLQGDVSINGGNGAVFGDGLRCAGNNVVRLQQVMSSPGGSSETSIDIAVKGGVLPGDTRTYQLWYRDPNLSPCGTNFNLSNGLRFTWNP